ncbi:hypothetical protein PVK06_026744 [Gossypium arboreum]|uniref:Uncharacterized protein n=1 Tax=Gossypium arboreum TaxID=29729 RepID=A0ABR0NYT9_GOSAR|nr:hypothetical protein PVK06_026744 [Gossypium arboreum]
MDRSVRATTLGALQPNSKPLGPPQGIMPKINKATSSKVLHYAIPHCMPNIADSIPNLRLISTNMTSLYKKGTPRYLPRCDLRKENEIIYKKKRFEITSPLPKGEGRKSRR